MLTLYRAPRSDDSDDSSSDSDDESLFSRKIPPGTPYITKVRGKLVMAREKREKRADVVVDLLGEAFGPRTRIIRRRSKSLEPEKGPLLIDGVTYVPQIPSPATYSAPIPQQPMAPMPPYVPVEYAQAYPQRYYPGPVQTYLVEHPKPDPRTQHRAEPKPSKEDFAKLVDMDEHFHKTSEEALKALNSKASPQEKGKVVATKTTITIVKHVCANCGRLRSRKYHHEHPIKEGEVPAAAFCRKCQRDASSTSESSETEREDRKRRKKKNRKKAEKHKSKENPKKPEDISSGEDIPQPKSKHDKTQNRQPSPNQQERVAFDPREDYIVAEEELSEEELRPRGRKREKIIVEEYHGPSRAHSPPDPQSRSHRARSAVGRQKNTYGSTARTQHHRQRSPSSDNTRDEVPLRHNDARLENGLDPNASIISYLDEVRYDGPVPVTRGRRRQDEPAYPRKIPVRYVEGVRKPMARDAEPHRPENRDHPKAHNYSVEDVESVSARSRGRHDTFDERSTSTREHPDWDRVARDHSAFSSRSFEARRRRRRERSIPDVQPWEAPHAIDPDVATEQFEHRKPRHDEETRRTQEYADRTQEYIDRATLGSHHEPRRFSSDDAARYFNDDWARREPSPPTSAPVQQHAPPRQSFRRERIRAPSPSSESSYDYTISRVGNPLPRVPTPPSPMASRSGTEHWEAHSEHHEHRHSEDSMPRAEREDSRAAQGSRQSQGARGASAARSEHNRDQRAEHTKPPSPPRSRETREHLTMISEGSLASGMTERERMAELGVRHVSFRETPSERLAPAWPSSFEHSPTTNQPQKFEPGWDNGDSPGNGSQW